MISKQPQCIPFIRRGTNKLSGMKFLDMQKKTKFQDFFDGFKFHGVSIWGSSKLNVQHLDWYHSLKQRLSVYRLVPCFCFTPFNTCLGNVNLYLPEDRPCPFIFTTLSQLPALLFIPMDLPRVSQHQHAKEILRLSSTILTKLMTPSLENTEGS